MAGGQPGELRSVAVADTAGDRFDDMGAILRQLPNIVEGTLEGKILQNGAQFQIVDERQYFFSGRKAQDHGVEAGGDHIFRLGDAPQDLIHVGSTVADGGGGLPYLGRQAGTDLLCSGQISVAFPESAEGDMVSQPGEACGQLAEEAVII